MFVAAVLCPHPLTQAPAVAGFAAESEVDSAILQAVAPYDAGYVVVACRSRR